MAADPKRFARAVVLVTVGGLIAPAVAAPGVGIMWLLFVASSVHVAATFALFSFSDVRRHARANPRRYLLAPLLLLVATSMTAAVTSARTIQFALLGFFGWQLWHYQQQNLGITALVARATGQPPLTTTERRCIRAAGAAGILALLTHPNVTQLVDIHLPTVATHAGTAIAWSLLALALMWQRRLLTLLAVAFPLPLLLTTSPYAALGGATLAHGLQYLLLVALVLAGPTSLKSRAVEGVLLVAGVLAIAGALAAASHLHHGPATTRAVFGAYLGIVMTHFVVDAGLWRMRDPFPRQWLGERLPALVTPSPRPHRLAIHRAPV